MSTYSEHVKFAQREIDGVHEWQESEGETDATLLASAGIAQAEAMLAVAEQQRIANLIAAINGDTSYYSAVGSAAQEVLGADVLNPDIADALGITGQVDSKTAGAA